MTDAPEDELIEAIQRLSAARELRTVTAIVRDTARQLSGADGVTFVLREGDFCFYADESAIEPLWKGRRFPIGSCISGWVMAHRTAVAIEDVLADPRIPQELYRPTFVKSMAMVPVQDTDPIAAIGAYWARRHAATEQELRILRVLADASALALSRSPE